VGNKRDVSVCQKKFSRKVQCLHANNKLKKIKIFQIIYLCLFWAPDLRRKFQLPKLWSCALAWES